MKTILVSWGLFLIGTTSLFGQSRLSVAPTYWFNYGKYSYRVHAVYDGSDTQVSGHDISSSAGLTARYRFAPRWDLSLGLLYNWNSSHQTSPPNSYGNNNAFRSKAIQVPVLINYRLTDHRLSPYFSAGAFLGKSETFTESPVKVNGLVGIGIDYQFHPGLSLLVQPTASYLFNKPKSDPLFQFTRYTAYSVGLQIQLIGYF